MREIEATQAAAGLTPALFDAMADVYAELARRALAGSPPEEARPTCRLADRARRRSARQVQAEPARQ